MASAAAPGRSCPLAYRTGAAALARPADFHAETLYVAGGLYGNVPALERLLERFDAEPGDKALVFNGDFHWFDIEPQDFRRVTRTVLQHRALRGNVESELASPAAGAGCGCAYPDWVDDGVVARSNRIIERLRITAARFPGLVAQMSELPMHAVAQVGGERIGIVHGDADSLAGWGFSQETLGTPSGAAAALDALACANVRVFASSHSCLPVLQALGRGLVANNGAAGMPNFRGTRYGVLTRVSVRPCAGALYGARAGGVYVDALALDYDAAAWERRFLMQWPPGSDAHQSYFGRIHEGPDYAPAQALRPALREAA